jgi:hypothetical protein
MKIISALIICCLYSEMIQAQYLKITTIASGGGTVKLSDGYMSQVIGQSSIVSGTSKNQGTIFRQGFKHPGQFKKTLNKPSALQIAEAEQTWSFDAYPNPFTQNLNVRFASKTQFPVILQIFDLQGKLVWESNYAAGLTEIRLEKFQHFPTGKYIMQVFQQGKPQRLPIIKQID